jgi:hypothetical protein
MGQWPVDEAGEDLLDDRALAVCHIGIRCGLWVVGEERVMALEWEQGVSGVLVLDPPHDQVGVDLVPRRTPPPWGSDGEKSAFSGYPFECIPTGRSIMQCV